MNIEGKGSKSPLSARDRVARLFKSLNFLCLGVNGLRPHSGLSPFLAGGGEPASRPPKIRVAGPSSVRAGRQWAAVYGILGPAAKAASRWLHHHCWGGAGQGRRNGCTACLME